MTSARVIYEAAQRSMENFVRDFYEPNMRWLEEVHQEALRIFKGPSRYAYTLNLCWILKFPPYISR